MDIRFCFVFYLPFEGTRVSACVRVCVCSLKVYLAIRGHWSTERLSVCSGFKYILPTPSADCCYEGFACAFYSLLSPFGCLCFSKSHAPYGRVYFSLYVPGMHFEYRCEQLAKAKARSLVPPVLLFNTFRNTYHHLWLTGLSPGSGAGGDDGPKLGLCDFSLTVSAGSTALTPPGMPLGHQLISW